MAARLRRTLRHVEPGNLQFREIETEDFEKGYCALLGELSVVGTVSRAEFQECVRERNASGMYKTLVVEDVEGKCIAATATLVLERKFIHSCGIAGHVEDVVVSSEYRGKSLGKRVMQHLLQWARDAGCYKVILDCAESNTAFYERLGFKRKEVQMVTYLSYGLSQ